MTPPMPSKNDRDEGFILATGIFTHKYRMSLGGVVGKDVSIGPHDHWEGGDVGVLIGPDGNQYRVTNWHAIRKSAEVVLKENWDGTPEDYARNHPTLTNPNGASNDEP